MKTKTTMTPQAKILPQAQQMGIFAENVLAFWYEQLGYSIVCRNYRCSRGEIDIIAKQGASWVFVEVRGGRSHKDPQHAIATVQWRKQQKLWYAIHHYLSQQQEHILAEIRLDVVGLAVDHHGNLDLCRVTYDP